MLLQLKEIQNFYDVGFLPEACIYVDPYTTIPAYQLGFKAHNGEIALLCTQRNKLIIKNYKSLDAAYKTLVKIGFTSVTILGDSDSDSDPEPESDIAPPSAYNRVLS